MADTTGPPADLQGEDTTVCTTLSTVLGKLFDCVLFIVIKRQLATRERLSASVLSICSSVCRQNAKKRFSQKLSNLEIWSLLATCRKSYTIIGPLKSKMAEILHLENRHDVTFSAEGGPIWIKFRRLVQNDISPAVIWSKSKPDVEFQYVWANYMACPPRATCHIEGAATWRFQCHDPRATCHIAGCCHLMNSLS